ncbi:MAG: protein kinase [Gammaproteobacteria bacterium]|jgi:serine/threonine protein kinase|nr:protein kinase [Gammaproteobacteria bacterium]
MLSTLTPSEQILAIHQRLHNQTKTVMPAYYSKLPRSPKLIPVEKNPPHFDQRLPKSVSRRFGLFMETSKREGTLISPHAYRVLRQFQMERIMSSPIERNNPRPSNILIQTQSPEGKALKLKYPVLIGGNGELVAMMKTTKQQLGEGNYGTVFAGMDLDTHKFVAIKYHDLSKSKVSQIRKENKVMDEIGRLVTSLETDADCITVDEIAWGSEYTQMMIDRDNNPLVIEEILYRLDMAIKFFEQVKMFNDKGFLNRDVKLDNMIWDTEMKKAIMIDFGFAKKFLSIKGGTVNGTPIYMAPEIEEGTYSLASEAYACGVALIEMFSKMDIFEQVDQWSLAIEEFLKRKDPNIMINFFKRAASDLLDNPHLYKQLNPIVKIIKSLLNPIAEKRISIQEAIISLKAHYEKLGFIVFKTKSFNADKSNPLQISLEDMANDKIRDYVYQEISDEEKLKQVSPDSLLIILKRAIVDRNTTVFETILKHATLFTTQHHAYAQMLLKQAFQVFKVEDAELPSMDKLTQQTRLVTLNPMYRRSTRLCAGQPFPLEKEIPQSSSTTNRVIGKK